MAKKTTKKVKTEESFISNTDGLSYVERAKGKAEQRKKEKQDLCKFKVDKDIDKAVCDLDAFIAKSSSNIKVDTLSERGDIPYFIDTKSYALNWIITNSFHKGFPGTRAIMISGQCLGGDTKVNVRMLTDNVYNHFNGYIKDLFNMIKKLESFNEYIIDEFYNVKSHIEIQDENNVWIKISKLIVKEKPTVKLTFDNLNPIIVAEEHLIIVRKNLDPMYAKDLKNITIYGANDRISTVLNVEKYNDKELVYDMQVVSDTHLYQTADGIIHHNSGKGKSLILDSILGQNIADGGASYKFDIEDAGTQDFTEKIVGSKEIAERIRIISPSTLKKDTKIKDQAITIEKMNSILNHMIDYQASKVEKTKIKSIIVGIDSLTQLTSAKEMESNIGEKDKKDMTSAQKMRETFRVITQKQKFANMTLIGLAQLTADIGKMFGPKETENAKGTGFKYASSLSLQATKDKEILKTVNKGAPIPIGVKMRFKTTKNRIEFKGRDAWLHFYFNKGIDRWDGLLQLLAQYGIIKASAKADVYGDYKPTSTFKWIHPDTGEVINFKLPTFSKYMTEREDNQEILEIWEWQLNDIYADMMEGVNESEMFADDGPEDEEELFESDGEEEVDVYDEELEDDEPTD